MCVMSRYDSNHWANKGYPEFTKSAARNEDLNPKETARRIRRAHRSRAGIRLKEARYHRTIGHNLAARRDFWKAVGELRKGLFGR